MEYKGAIGGAYTYADKKLADQECLNFYPELSESGATLQPTGGYEDRIEFNVGGKIRALYRTTRGLGTDDPNPFGDFIVVCGSDVIHYDPSDDSYTTLGYISNILNVISIVDDGVGIVLADGEQLYRIDMDTLAFTIVDLDDVPIRPTKVAVLNFRTIIIGETENPGTISNKFYYSNVADNSTFESLSFYELADVRAAILSISVSNNMLYLYSVNQFQIWQTNASNSKNPFSKRTTGTDDIGLVAIDSVVEVAGNQFFVGSVDQGSAVIYMNGKVISTTPLNREFAKVDMSDTTSFSFTENGHIFVVFNSLNLGKTYVYDLTTEEWHRRGYRNQKGYINNWQPYFAVSYTGTLIMGSLDEAKLYTYSPDLNTQSDSRNILRVRGFPNLINEGRNIVNHRLYIRARVGEGFENNPTAPQLMMRYSNTGSYTKSARITTDLGARGDYDREVEFRRLGAHKQFMAEISISDDTNVVIHGVSIENNVAGGRR